jgi:hypothetical protein
MTDMDAGRELDERVARLVWGWPANKAPRSRRLHETHNGFLPACSLDLESAFLVLDTLAERTPPWGWSIEHDVPAERPYEVKVWSLVQGYGALYRGFAPTLPLAVCRAVVAALSPQEGA